MFWWLFSVLFVFVLMIDTFIRKKTGIPSSATVFASSGVMVFLSSFFPLLGAPLTHMKTGRIAVQGEVVYSMLAMAAFLFLGFALSMFFLRLRQDYGGESFWKGVSKNIKKMSPFFKLLVAFGLLVPIWIIFAAFSGVNVNGEYIDPWQWWQSGAGAVACYSVLMFFIASLLCAARSNAGRWLYVIAAVIYGLLPKVSALLLGIEFSVNYWSLLWDLSYWSFLVFYFSKAESVVNYFEDGNECANSGGRTTGKRRKRKKGVVVGKKGETLEPTNVGVGKPKKIISKPNYPVEAKVLQNDADTMWLYCVDGVEQGPIDEAALREAIINGEIKRFDTVKKVGDRFWCPVLEVLNRPGFRGGLLI